jgi:hypothetical protein
VLRVGAQASHAGPLFRDKADGPKLAEILTGALRGTGGGGLLSCFSYELLSPEEIPPRIQFDSCHRGMTIRGGLLA